MITANKVTQVKKIGLISLIAYTRNTKRVKLFLYVEMIMRTEFSLVY